MSSTIVKTDVELRPWEEADWPLLWGWMQDCWPLVSDDYSPPDLRSFVYYRQQQESINMGVWMDDELGGWLCLESASPIVAVGHAIFKRSFQRRSITVPALKQMMRFAWAHGFHKIACRVYPDNHSMIRLLISLGAVHQGVLYSEAMREGQLSDVENYALLREV